MRKFTWVVMTNCDPAHEKEFNAWYDDVHIGDLLRIPGVVAAKRSRLANWQMNAGENGALQLSDADKSGLKYRYLALYSIETDDIAAVLEDVRSRANTIDMVISPYLTEAHTSMYEER